MPLCHSPSIHQNNIQNKTYAYVLSPADASHLLPEPGVVDELLAALGVERLCDVVGQQQVEEVAVLVRGEQVLDEVLERYI